MSKGSKKEIAKAFKAAKKHLRLNDSVNKTAYICIALLDARKNGDITRDQWTCATDVISNRLGGPGSTYGTVTSWLRARIGHQEVDRASDVQIQAYRHAWLDQLIKEFSK